MYAVAALDSLTDPLRMVDSFDRELDKRAGPINRYWEYYRGEAKVLYATVKFRESFGRLLSEISDNWCEVIVDSAVERLRVTGFRFGGDDTADEEAWSIWQASYLDADQVLAHEECGVSSLCYLLVEPPGPDNDLPRISVLSPIEAITLNAPENRRRRIAGYRRFIDEAGIPEARLYLPDRVLVLFGKADKTEQDGGTFGDWEIVGELDNPAGVVPMVEMLNKAHLGRGGNSDLDPVLSKQDMINKLAVDMIVNSEYAAFHQRWATGIELSTDKRGRPVPPEQFLAGADSVFISENPDAKYGAFPISDGTIFVRQIEMLVQHVAAQTRTPPHYLTAGLGQWPSADSLRASEEGLVQKCRRKILGFGESWEEGMRIAFLQLGDVDRGRAQSLESIWDNPQRVSIAAITDATVKMRKSLGVPRRATWRMLGASPQEIDQWENEAQDEQPLPSEAVPTPAGATLPATPEQ
jgi:hypothetical protein